jgi:hypothetical protein
MASARVTAPLPLASWLADTGYAVMPARTPAAW